MTTEGKLIVIEGPDHVGRSMHARLLSERLKAHGVAVSIVGLARSTLLADLIKSSNTTMTLDDRNRRHEITPIQTTRIQFTRRRVARCDHYRALGEEYAQDST